VRQIDVRYEDGLALPTTDKVGTIFKDSVALKAGDPLFYDPTMRGANLWTAPEGWSIPWSIPWVIGGDDAITQVDYTGSADSLPMLYLIGPMSSPIITNEITDETIDLTGATIVAGDIWTVNCMDTYKTIKDSSGNSKMNYLSEESDLATFHLAAAIDGSSTRANVFRVQVSGTSTVSQILLKYYRRYLGA
jgi:hypothetical protein